MTKGSIQYSSGVRVEVRRNPFTGTPEDFYKAQVAEGVPGEVVPIHGVNVFVVPQGDESNLGSATMVVKGLLVMIVGDGDFIVEQLQALASSVPESAGPASGAWAPRGISDGCLSRLKGSTRVHCGWSAGGTRPSARGAAMVG